MALNALNSRVEADEFLELIADVQDDETSVEELIYEWSSDKDPGTFVGTGRRVRWRAPQLKPTPDSYVLTLTVVENYEENGETKAHRVSANTSVHYNDSVREVGTMATAFLRDFSTFAVSPEACVRNFTDSCPEKFSELRQIQNNRRNYRIQSGTFSIRSIRFNTAKTNATAILPCQFTSIVVIPTQPGHVPGQTVTVKGDCTITAVYETGDNKWRWYLCNSRFSGTETIGGNLYGLVP